MNIFDLRSNDVFNFDRYMDLTKPGYGGPKESIPYDAKKPKFEKWQHVAKRDGASENGVQHPNYDSAWAAFTNDLVHKQAKIAQSEIRHAVPSTATRPVEKDEKGENTRTMVEFEPKKNNIHSMSVTEKLIKEGRIALFEEFQDMQKGEDKGLPGEVSNLLEPDNLPKEEYRGPDVDQEKLDLLLENFDESIETIVGDVMEAMELEKEEVCDLLCAAFIKLCKPDLEEEEDEDKDKEGKGEKKEGEKPKKKKRRPRKKKPEEAGAPAAAPPAAPKPKEEHKKPEPQREHTTGGKEEKKGVPFGKQV